MSDSLPRRSENFYQCKNGDCPSLEWLKLAGLTEVKEERVKEGNRKRPGMIEGGKLIIISQ